MMTKRTFDDDGVRVAGRAGRIGAESGRWPQGGRPIPSPHPSLIQAVRQVSPASRAGKAEEEGYGVRYMVTGRVKAEEEGPTDEWVERLARRMVEMIEAMGG